MKSSSRGPLPFMKTMEDATAISEKEGDNFYVTAFLIEAWLADVTLDVVAEYADNKQGKDRAIQAGGAWKVFLRFFGHAQDAELPHLMVSLCRFSEYDDVQSELLLQAIYPLSLEHQSFGDFVGPKTNAAGMSRAEGVALLRRSFERWCDWIDSVVHFQTHAHWHLSPASFDPDPEKRELATLGVNQRCFPHLSEFGQKWWQWHHGEAAERFKNSPKWQSLGKAMASMAESQWAYPELDELIICFWPLLKRHNWTYRDLLNVVREVVPRPDSYPCEREQDLASYCTNVLGLRKSGQGKTAKNGRPTGYDVAVLLCKKASPPPS
jgi:hypothetical protein